MRNFDLTLNVLNLGKEVWFRCWHKFWSYHAFDAFVYISLRCNSFTDLTQFKFEASKDGLTWMHILKVKPDVKEEVTCAAAASRRGFKRYEKQYRERNGISPMSWDYLFSFYSWAPCYFSTSPQPYAIYFENRWTSSCMTVLQTVMSTQLPFRPLVQT